MAPACAAFPYRDEAGRRPDFVAFRRASAIERRDLDAVVAVAAPDICLSFGGNSGHDQLRQLLAQSPEHWEIRTVHAGGRCVPVEVAARLAEHLADDDLTPRELDVIGLIREGYRNKQISTSASRRCITRPGQARTA